MFTFFSCHKCVYRTAWQKAQMAPFFIALITIIIIAMLFTVNLNKVSLHKVYTANAADAGVLAGASQLAFAFDQLSFQSKYMYDTYQTMITDFAATYAKAQEYIYNVTAIFYTAIGIMALGAGNACWPYLTGQIIFATTHGVIETIMAAAQTLVYTTVIPAVGTLDGIVEGMQPIQAQLYANLWGNMDDSFRAGLDLARDYAFLNSGINVSDDVDINGNIADTDGDGENDIPSQADEFSFFISDSDTPDTFCWRDERAASDPVTVAQLSSSGITCQSQLDDTPHRIHVAGVSVFNSDPPQTYQLIETIEDMNSLRNRFAIIYGSLAAICAGFLALGRGAYAMAETVLEIIPCPGWHLPTPTPIPLCIIWNLCVVWAGYSFALQASASAIYEGLRYLVDSNLEGVWQGIQPGSSFCDNTGVVDDATIPVTVGDIDYDDYTIGVATFQEHQGEDLGLWRAEYPRITSTARATYECNLGDCPPSYVCSPPFVGCNPATCGSICSHSCSCINGMNPCQGHRPQLVGVDESM